jgi:hypothetical protein
VVEFRIPVGHWRKNLIRSETIFFKEA